MAPSQLQTRQIRPQSTVDLRGGDLKWLAQLALLDEVGDVHF